MDLQQTISQCNRNSLENVLVLSVKKSFWASEACEIFPNRIYPKVLYGRSQNLINSVFLALKGLKYIATHKPKLILFGSAHKTVPWFITLKQAGLLPNVKLVATNQESFSDRQAHHLEKIIIYSRSQVALHEPGLRDKYEFMPLPADGNFELCQPVQAGNYIFTGGGEGRDFQSLIEAVKGLDVKIKIVTFDPETLGNSKQLPDNCEVFPRMPLQDFLNLMAGARFVVVPLKEGLRPHGHTTIVQAQRLAKAVITTKQASVDDYVIDGQNGILVSPGDIAGYRQAIIKLLAEPNLRQKFEQNARIAAMELTYEAYAKRLITLCHRLLA